MGGGGNAAGETATLMATHRGRVLHRLSRLSPSTRTALLSTLEATLLDGVAIDYAGLLPRGAGGPPRGSEDGIGALFGALGSVGMNSLDRYCLEGHWRNDVLPRITTRRRSNTTAASPQPPLSPMEAAAVKHLERHGYVTLREVGLNAATTLPAVQRAVHQVQRPQNTPRFL